jgi:hypothetical protein
LIAARSWLCGTRWGEWEAATVAQLLKARYIETVQPAKLETILAAAVAVGRAEGSPVVPAFPVAPFSGEDDHHRYAEAVNI